MTLPYLLRRFHHLTLTASCICLIVALLPIIPSLPGRAARMGSLLWLLAMLTLFAGRFRGYLTLSGWLANGLALLATGICLAWVKLHWNHLASRPMPIALVPCIGPLLLVLLVLRLYRPYSPRDLWMLQGMGLLQVALACTLTTESLFGLLLLFYLALALPLLALAQLENARHRAGFPEEELHLPRLPGRIATWTGSVFLVGLILFLVMPRLTWESWDPFQQLGVRVPRKQGGSIELSNTIDLNQTGTVTLGKEDAFEVQVISKNDGPPPPLPPDVHWRTGVLNVYEQGKWRWQPTGFSMRPPPWPVFPEPQPGELLLRFHASPREAGGLPLAEPVLFAAPRQRTVMILRGGRDPFGENEGTLLSPSVLDNPYTYQQIARPGVTRWPLAFPPPLLVEKEQSNLIHHLTQLPLPRLGDWTRNLLEQLARDHRFGLREEHLPPWPQPTDEVPLHADRLAFALTGYLARSGDFTYTLEVRSHDTSLDPTLDFLWNVRQGHCERYASALALMLRSQGIPARIVRGFRGAEPSEPHRYVVSQSQAHAWVEALVPAEQQHRYDWISLEPTPDIEPATPRSWGPWDYWEQFTTWQETIWNDLIVGYNANQQTAFWRSWIFSAQAAWFFFAFGVVLVVVTLFLIVLRRLWLRWQVGTPRTPLASFPALHRLWELLRRHQLLTLDPSRTALELATQAEAALSARADTASHAALPGWLVALFYRDHFGGVPMTAEEKQSAEARVKALSVALNQPVSAVAHAPG